MEVAHLLLVNAVALAAIWAMLWLVNLSLRDPSFVDIWWALGIVLIAFLSLMSTGQGRLHASLLTGLSALWGLRLGFYLLWRWLRRGPDPRYSAMMDHARKVRGWSYARGSLLLVFAIQPPLQFIVSLPVQLGQIGDAQSLGVLGWLGAAAAIAGVTVETLADLQLAGFRSDPMNTGKVLDVGLWRYSRHPNYFGEACVWWGLFLIAADSGPIGWASLPAPILITIMLTRWSGVPTVETRMRHGRPAYEAYVARTSAFIPLPPKRS